MPELPEVETIVRDLSKSLQSKIFSDVIVHDAFILRQPQKDFTRRIAGVAIERITRRGKSVIIHISSGEFLVVQLMMTGQLVFDGKKDKHTRLTFNFSDGSTLLYNDQRRFGQVRVVANLSEVKHFKILGPESFSKEFSPELMREEFMKTARPVKSVLLDHTFVAGIGNIYACEILFRGRIDPRRQARRINTAEIKKIHHMITEVLQEAIDHRGSSMRNYRDGKGQKGRFNERLAVYARQGLPCPRCRKPVLRITQAGRGTFYCEHCQK